jgi:hypothetical protein
MHRWNVSNLRRFYLVQSGIICVNHQRWPQRATNNLDKLSLVINRDQQIALIK